jgi:hypothetical protein
MPRNHGIGSHLFFPCIRGKNHIRWLSGNPLLHFVAQNKSVSMQYICKKIMRLPIYLRKHHKSCMKIFPLLLFILSSLYIHAQTADEVISKYVAFIGGEKQWKGVSTIITSGDYTYGGVAFPFKAHSKAPNLYKFVVSLNGKYYAQAFDGKAGWKIDVFNGETAPTILNGKPAIAMANEADVDIEDALIDYKNKGHQASMEGKDSVQGKRCFKIKFIRKNGGPEIYYFDEKTAELVMKKAPAKNPELGGAELNILYSDYRFINEIKIPFKTTIKTPDQTILTISITKAEINTAIEDTEFQWRTNR